MNAAELDLIAIGDSTIDTFIKIHDATIECDLNKRDYKLCIPYGSKIPVDEIDYGVAGNAANAVTGCAKLGLKTAIYTNLGDDDQGHRIAEAFENAKVSMDYVKVNKNKKSNLSVVLTFQGERTIFVYHQDWYYRLPKLAPCKWVYLTSMAETFTGSNIVDDIEHYLDRSHAKLAFGPGTFQIKADIKRYPRILERCEVLVLNMEEAKKVLAIDSKESPSVRDLLSKLLMLGPKIVVVTDGPEGSYASDGDRYLRIGVLPTKITEKTGAGDAYSAGLIAALLENLDLTEAMAWGATNAAAVISRLVTQTGQLTKAEILKKRKLMPKFIGGNL